MCELIYHKTLIVSLMDRKRSKRNSNEISAHLRLNHLAASATVESEQETEREREREREREASVDTSKELSLSPSLLQRIQFPRSDGVRTCIYHGVYHYTPRVIGKRIDSLPLTVDFRRSVLFRKRQRQNRPRIPRYRSTLGAEKRKKTLESFRRIGIVGRWVWLSLSLRTTANVNSPKPEINRRPVVARWN